MSRRFTGIPKSSLKKFLNRSRDDLREWKKYTNTELRYEADCLPKRPPYWKKMRKVQRACFLIGAIHKKVAFHLDTGSGKTFLSLSLIKYFGLTQDIYRTLVLVPRNVNKFEWVREIKKHTPNMSYVVLEGSSERKWELLEEADDEIVVATYMGVARMVCDLVKDKKKKKQKLKPNVTRVKKLCKLIDGLVLDESTEIGSKSSLSWRICRKISQTANMVIELTGTPFGRDPTPLWSQMYLLDDGYSLGENLGVFRAALFKTVDNYWSGFPDFVFDKKKESLLHEFLAHRSIRYEAAEQDLPKLVRIPKEISVTKDVEAYYEKARSELIAAHGNYKEQKSAFVRMRQLSSGFIGYHDDETGERAQFEFDPNPKLEMLLSLVDSVYRKHKAIVVHDFVYTGHMVCRELKKLDIDHVGIFGKIKNQHESLQKFVSDNDCRILVMNTSGAFGLNLQVAKYMFVYESPVPVILRKQIERRMERQYSEHDTVFLYDLISKSTYDQRILDTHQEGGDLFEAIINGRVRV